MVVVAVVAFLSLLCDRDVRRIHHECSDCGGRGGSGGAVVKATGRGFGDGSERGGYLFATTAPTMCLPVRPTRSLLLLAFFVQ